MSDLIPGCQLSDSILDTIIANKAPLQKISTREAKIGEGLVIRRALPHRDRHLIGAWCFLDHFGPVKLTSTSGLTIGPHPHIGLQTFTYLLQGEILHRDSLGSEQLITPHEVNLMTAGNGISHSEESVLTTADTLHGVQLWIALPESNRFDAPHFAHYSELPTYQQGNLKISVLAGEYAGHTAPARVYTPLVGLELQALEAVDTTLALQPSFEHGILVLTGNVWVNNEPADVNTLFYFSCGYQQVNLRAEKDARILIIGGAPLHEEIIIWWNFVARNQEEIKQAIQDWQEHKRFGVVKHYLGDRLPAPPFPG